MKEIWAIIRREKYAETKRALDKVGCGAMSVHSVWGRGKQGGFIMSEAESELALYATSWSHSHMHPGVKVVRLL